MVSTQYDDVTYVYDDVTYVYDDVTYVYDDVTYMQGTVVSTQPFRFNYMWNTLRYAIQGVLFL